MKLDVIKLDGGKGGQIDLPDDIFGIEVIRADILQRVVTWQLAKRRAGTHKIKTRNEVARTGKKMYRQKGTGGAALGELPGDHALQDVGADIFDAEDVVGQVDLTPLAAVQLDDVELHYSWPPLVGASAPGASWTGASST